MDKVEGVLLDVKNYLTNVISSEKHPWIMNKDLSDLKRPIHPMPEFVERALKENDLMKEYKNRPPYQQNDYIGWINRAKMDETKQKRLKQMLEELEKGNVYMKMKWNSRL